MASFAQQDRSRQRRKKRSPKKVLIVDDNLINRKILRELLQSEGYETAEAEDGLAALDVLEHATFDAVVCDVLMPNMDGYGLCGEVRRRAEFKSLFFLLYTAIDFTPNDEKIVLSLGADRFISKQGSPTAVLKSIEESLGENRKRRCEHPSRASDPPFESDMKMYNALMIQRLEDKSIELEQAHAGLRNLNEKLGKLVGERTAQLEIANKQLEISNNQLEQRVADRTDELAVKNAVLETRTKELARTNADLGQFASAASHDLQQPLRAVAGCIQLFERKHLGKLDQKSDELIRMIVDGAGRMKALIDGLLAFSRPVVDEKLEVIDAGIVLQDVLTDLKVAISESKAEVLFGKLPSLRFVRAQFGEVLQNLVGNAIKYRSSVRPKIRVSAQRQTGAWIFSIADNGIGFEQQYAEKVFGVFQRLHTREQYPGTGIGLAIGKKIIERHGGKIWVESVPNHGSTFFFSIPDNDSPSKVLLV